MLDVFIHGLSELHTSSCCAPELVLFLCSWQSQEDDTCSVSQRIGVVESGCNMEALAPILTMLSSVGVAVKDSLGGYKSFKLLIYTN